jgi:hypothetical protein
MQAALRIEIDQLEPGLTITDDGAERSVDSGLHRYNGPRCFGRDSRHRAQSRTRRATSRRPDPELYGHVAAEEENETIRGILVASSFDAKAKAAARMVPSLVLRKYSVRFLFSDGHS